MKIPRISTTRKILFLSELWGFTEIEAEKFTNKEFKLWLKVSPKTRKLWNKFNLKVLSPNKKTK